VLTAVFLLGMPLQASALVPFRAQPDPRISVLLNGEALEFDVPPVTQQGRTLVPLRTIFESLGATVEWDAASSTVKASKGGTTIELPVGRDWAIKNGTRVSLDVPAVVKDGRTLVPLRFVSEALGTRVDWDGQTRTVSITPLEKLKGLIGEKGLPWQTGGDEKPEPSTTLDKVLDVKQVDPGLLDQLFVGKEIEPVGEEIPVREINPGSIVLKPGFAGGALFQEKAIIYRLLLKELVHPSLGPLDLDQTHDIKLEVRVEDPSKVIQKTVYVAPSSADSSGQGLLLVRSWLPAGSSGMHLAHQPLTVTIDIWHEVAKLATVSGQIREMGQERPWTLHSNNGYSVTLDTIEETVDAVIEPEITSPRPGSSFYEDYPRFVLEGKIKRLVGSGRGEVTVKGSLRSGDILLGSTTQQVQIGQTFQINVASERDLGRNENLSLDLKIVDTPSNVAVLSDQATVSDITFFSKQNTVRSVVVLIHGVWSGPQTYQDFKNKIWEKELKPGTWLIEMNWAQGEEFPTHASDSVGGRANSVYGMSDDAWVGVAKLKDVVAQVRYLLGFDVPITILSHSQGTIITLAALQEGMKVDNWILMGSPLDKGIVRDGEHNTKLGVAARNVSGKVVNLWSNDDGTAWLKGGIGEDGLPSYIYGSPNNTVDVMLDNVDHSGEEGWWSMYWMERPDLWHGFTPEGLLDLLKGGQGELVPVLPSKKAAFADLQRFARRDPHSGWYGDDNYNTFTYTFTLTPGMSNGIYFDDKDWAEYRVTVHEGQVRCRIREAQGSEFKIGSPYKRFGVSPGTPQTGEYFYRVQSRLFDATVWVVMENLASTISRATLTFTARDD